jgi:hypothetical protein
MGSNACTHCAARSAILCRDKSIVVNLEHIKVIITRDRVLVVNHEDPANAQVCCGTMHILAGTATAA